MSRVLLASFDRVPSPKGASQHILANARHLAERHEVSLLTLGDAPMPGWRHMTVTPGEPHFLDRALAFRRHVESVLAMAPRPFDVVHVRSPWEGLAVPFGQPLIYEVNGLPSIELVYRFPHLGRQPALIERLRHQEVALMERARAIVTPAPRTRDYLVERGVDPDGIHVVPNAPSFAPQPQDEAVVREARGAPDDPLRMVYLGTLHEWQGVGMLLRALSHLPGPQDGGVAWTLDIFTGANRAQRKALVRQARRRGLAERIALHEPLSHDALREALRGFDLGLAPLTPCSRNLVQGCMPIKLLDYMAAGLPVVAPQMQVVRDTVGPDYALHARHGRVALTRALQECLGDPERRAELATLGLQRVREHFSSAHQKRALLEVYARVLEDRPAPAASR